MQKVFWSIKSKNFCRVVCLFLTLVLTAIFFVGCVNDNNDDDKLSGQPIKLSFKSSSGYDYLKSLDGKLVTIIGYMATSSPVDGSFIFLMNLPYQSCPFCLPNTSQLSNTIEVYPQSGKSFEYTNQAIQVVGRLVVAQSVDEPFTDKYGYEFNFKIVDARYSIVSPQDLSPSMVLWQKIASSDVISEVYKAYDYLNFLCAWNTYFINSYVDENGKTVTGYYLWPSDAERFIYNDNAQFNYGYQEGYFDGIIAKIKQVDETAFDELVANIRKVEAHAKTALLELQNKNYTYEYIYVEKFGTYDNVYTLTNGEQLIAQMKSIFAEFESWLGEWEL